MNIGNVKKYADSECEVYKIAKAVTEVKNKVKNDDITMSDYFKTLKELLIKKQDEKQKELINQLRENQLAITAGLEGNKSELKILIGTYQDLVNEYGYKQLPFPEKDKKNT